MEKGSGKCNAGPATVSEVAGFGRSASAKKKAAPPNLGPSSHSPPIQPPISQGGGGPVGSPPPFAPVTGTPRRPRSAVVVEQVRLIDEHNFPSLLSQRVDVTDEIQAMSQSGSFLQSGA